ncbi:hypothetical protein F5J12DRAFT_727784 [Pisolithus orientalis]|uniref:uncharacterized protein n=1 Tax=Pisolithus orientalis TaxID=936130 RepID=UPI0022244118|nr:uncharacterized protein F5J12DRAFT_727784 [Pisolithus orientalis]KAI5989799.1 hypothetical protein F5J12DRAFT_727784 [Pisolithus orientalis]
MHNVPGPVAGRRSLEQAWGAFEFNTFAALRVTSAIVRSVIKRREGLVINIELGTMVNNTSTTPLNTLYCVAKAALRSIAGAIRHQLSDARRTGRCRTQHLQRPSS